MRACVYVFIVFPRNFDVSRRSRRKRIIRKKCIYLPRYLVNQCHFWPRKIMPAFHSLQASFALIFSYSFCKAISEKCRELFSLNMYIYISHVCYQSMNIKLYSLASITKEKTKSYPAPKGSGTEGIQPRARRTTQLCTRDII